MTRINNNSNEPVRTPIEPTLSNYPVDVVVTFSVNGETPIVYNFDDEKDVRNFLARLVPVDTFKSAPEEVLSYVTDSTSDMFTDLLEIARGEGLSLPIGI